MPGWFLFGVAVFVICSYALYMSDQCEVESRFAPELARRFTWYPAEFPDTPITNLAQVLYGSHGGYPYQWHEWFRVYEKNAGFSNSLSEKYVAVPPGVSIGKGDSYLISAQPFFHKGDAYRMIFYKRERDVWGEKVAEYRVQDAFQTARVGIPVPSAALMPPAPPPTTFRSARRYYLSAWLETRGLFSRLEWSGVSPQMARVIEKACFWGLAAVCASIIGYCLWPVPYKRHLVEHATPAIRWTTAKKICSVIGWTFGFLFVVGLMSPSFGSDRGLGQLYFHLSLPYSAWWEALPREERPGDAFGWFLLLGQIGAYDFMLCYEWIRNRLGKIAIVLTLVHLFAIAFSIFAAVSRK